MWILDLYCCVAANECDVFVFESCGNLEGDGAIASNWQCRGAFDTREEAEAEGERLIAELKAEKMRRVRCQPYSSRF